MGRKFPWIGLAKPMPPGAFETAAKLIGCEVAAIRAIWEVEAASRGFLRDGSLIRRFEPHHIPGSDLTWRDSLKIGPANREKMMIESFRASPSATLRATSWGAPQIMGFNAAAAGYPNAFDMVSRLADAETEHLTAFVALVKTWGIDGKIRAHDWRGFAARYNGSGQPDAYARKIEAAYRRHSGKSSPVVLKVGARGAAVDRLQRALAIAVDGAFGPETATAVKEFQRAAALPVDGVVGARTWAALENQLGAIPKLQGTTADKIAEEVGKWGAVIGGVGTAAASAREFLPPAAFDALGYGAVGVAVFGLAALMFRKIRAG